jgi:ribonucleotide monophosphatase NagD (HAD superfamily)
MDISTIRNLLIDGDGVLYRGTESVGDLAQFFSRLDALGINWALLTNNATRMAETYTDKLSGFGVALPRGRIFTSAVARPGSTPTTATTCPTRPSRRWSPGWTAS